MLGPPSHLSAHLGGCERVGWVKVLTHVALRVPLWPGNGGPDLSVREVPNGAHTVMHSHWRLASSGGRGCGKDPGAVGSIHRATAQLHSGIKALGYASVDPRPIEGQMPSSEDGVIWGQHTSAAQGRQPQGATRKSPHSKRRRPLL